MSEIKKILVFPCGSEIGLEVHRALGMEKYIELYGASSVDDHGRFVYNNYISGIPFITDPGCIIKLKEAVKLYNIDMIFPTMDEVIAVLKKNEAELDCYVISSSYHTAQIAYSKSATYKILADAVKIPAVYNSGENIETFPVFVKPDKGYGSRGTRVIWNREEFDKWSENPGDNLVLEYLPGQEYTVDCFTDKGGNLKFAGPRIRKRISGGISVNTVIVEERDRFIEFADKINNTLELRGAWFFQVKEDKKGDLTLMEVACRFAGSSAIFRCRGVNFPLLTIFDALDYDVEILENNFSIELDRALENRYKINLDFNTIYMDLDDCIVINDKVNPPMISFIFEMINRGKEIILITKHRGDLQLFLKKHRIELLFDEIIHLDLDDEKSEYIKKDKSILIDDSYSERIKCFRRLKIAVFAPDAVESLY